MLWATESVEGRPAGTVHINRADRFGRPLGTVCGLSGEGMCLFPGMKFESIPVLQRCRDGEAARETAATLD
jgi:hypothetical protein